MSKDKILYVNSIFNKSEPLPTADGEIQSIYIEGRASTTDVDRQEDVIPASVWEEGIKNYLKNPVILAYHHYDEPVGRMVEHNIDEGGLWVKARISAASEDVFNLIKDGIMTAFSVGFRIKDAEYNAAAEVFIIKELELMEISVVSVPANQNTLFSLSKSFKDDNEYKSFKMQFSSVSESAKGLDKSTTENITNKEELNMDANELKQMLADAVKEGANAVLTKQAQDAAIAAKAKQDEADLQARISAAATKAVEVGESGAEKLLADVEKRFAEQEARTAATLEGLQADLKAKAAELEAIQKSKMQFGESNTSGVSYEDKEKAVILSIIMHKSIEDTKFGRSLVEKVGAHAASATWEKEVSMNMESEVRRRLVVAPTLRAIPMQTNVMTVPINPEAGVGTWVTNAQFGTTASTGAEVTHALTEITLNAYKVATLEYLTFEEDEDSLIVLLPIIRDAMIRRLARSIDRAFIRGAGAGADPVKGLALYDAVPSVAPAVAGAATVAHMKELRRDLGAWGLDPSELVYVVSTDVYYDLLDDTNFMTLDKVGAAATLLTGQIGAIGNTPVLVSSEFEAKAATKYGAICYAPANFIVGNQRGLRMDMQDLAETQRRVMVASMRTGLVQTTTNLGGGVSSLKWAV